ncbi:hypothetical protein Pcinc_041466 [Petrolisthes cinctipes]|uniref:Uncharacterized protein n=1 Tax=Petrolisthes cinctipes TaxID=88211 RepID=A0AAE1BJI0_PETCI|nr:hypothetical protein Pcinc_041466 [Petrolisthes cinctipes]
MRRKIKRSYEWVSDRSPDEGLSFNVCITLRMLPRKDVERRGVQEINEVQPLNHPSTQAQPLKHHHFSTKNLGAGLNHYYLYPESSYLRQDS